MGLFNLVAVGAGGVGQQEQGLHGDEREAASPPSLSLSDRTLERLGFGAPQVRD